MEVMLDRVCLWTPNRTPIRQADRRTAGIEGINVDARESRQGLETSISNAQGNGSRPSLPGDYEPSPAAWVRDQVAEYERSGGARANTLRDTGLPVIVVTMRGNKSGKVRKIALMRVEHGGDYALVASKGGAPEHPVWYYNLTAHPDDVIIQDGPVPFPARVRQVTGNERAEWWARAVAAYPPYAQYQKKTDREIPVFVATRKS
jgi:F420H(2)-dependent quinone reductase